MLTRHELETLIPVGTEVLSGGKRTWFRITKFTDDGVRIASTSSKKTALLRYPKLRILLDNFDQINSHSIQDGIMELMREHGQPWNVHETFLYGLAREYRLRTGAVSLSELNSEFQRRVEEIARLDATRRNSILSTSSPKPKKITVQSTAFLRNPAVAAEVLLRANGYCESCKEPAPFRRKTDGTPYLEVHHCIPLSENGDDTVENSIALCPNCHRRMHHA